MSHRIADFLRARTSTNIGRGHAGLDHDLDSCLYQCAFLRHVQRVQQQHRHRQNRRDGVHDAFACDVWRAAVDGLVDPVAQAFAVGHAAQARRGQETQASRDHARLVGDDVAEQVARDDDAVQSPRVLHHQHRRAVDEVVAKLQLRELLLHDLGDDASPQATRREHVGLVQTPHLGGRALRERQVGGEARDALDLLARVGLAVLGRLVFAVGWVGLAAVAKVDAAGEFAHDHEVGAFADGLFERRDLGQRGAGEGARTQVAECLHLFAQLEQALFRPYGAGAPFRTADGAEDDGVRGFGGVQSFIGEWFAVGVY